MEIKIGKAATAEAMTQTIAEPIEVSNYDDAGEDYEILFSVADDGVYYVGVHAISDADMDRLTLNTLAVGIGPMPTSPASPELEVTADAKGEVVSLGDILVIDNIRFGSKSNITAVRDIKRDATAQSDYFDLNGRKLAGRPLTKGVFVTDGKKVIVK